MPDTLVALAVAVVAVLPGFVTVELTQRQRAVQPGSDTQSTVLRALFYALLIHLLWIWWTWRLVERISSIASHPLLVPIVCWVVVVLIVSPIVIGLWLNRLLRHAENRGSLSWWHFALGARDARDAWDSVFQRAAEHGAWVLVHLKGDGPRSPRVALGRYGNRSSAGQSPAEHDLFLQEMWTVDRSGRPVSPLNPPRGMWVAKEAITELYVFDGDLER